MNRIAINHSRARKTWSLRLLSAVFAVVLSPLALAAVTPVPAPTLKPDEINNSLFVSPLSRPAKGSAVLRAQVLLDRAYFSPGEIDGAFGLNMRTAVLGFQKTRQLRLTGVIDAATWKALHSDIAPVLSDYTVTAADVAGPFVAIPTDMMEKANLPALGYESAAEALGERFHISPLTLQQLNPGKDLSRVGEVLAVPNVTASAALPKAAKVVVDQSSSTVALVDEAGKTIAQFPASSGSKHDPLPLGNWKIKGVARNPSFSYNPKLFWDADEKHSKAKLPAGPNNPVGVVWVDLSKEHYGIHGTPKPKNIGKTESHGCIRLSNWNATTLAEAVSPGMPAILQR